MATEPAASDSYNQHEPDRVRSYNSLARFWAEMTVKPPEISEPVEASSRRVEGDPSDP